MRRSGTITKWNDEKAYGFIAPDDRTDDVFLHARALVEKQRRPEVGDKVFYDLTSEEGKGPRALRVVLRSTSVAGTPTSPPPPSPALFKFPTRAPAPAPSPTQEPRRSRPPKSPRSAPDSRSVGGLSLVLMLLFPANVLGALWLAAVRGHIPSWVALLYLGMSLVATVAYALDKFRAQRGKWRISEGTLHLFEMAGGWPGAFVAQRLFRHKIRKLSFQVTYWIIVVAHLAFWSWFAATQSGWLLR